VIIIFFKAPPTAFFFFFFFWVVGCNTLQDTQVEVGEKKSTLRNIIREREKKAVGFYIGGQQNKKQRWIKVGG
jgi:hypothetical protein